MKKVVFTGGTYVGKSSVIELLKKDGYLVGEEVAVKNIEILINLLGMEEYRKRRKENFLEFQRMNIFATLQRDNEIIKQDGEVCCLDRGIFDFIASLRRESIEIPQSIEELVENVNYDLIFLFEELPRHICRSETWRMLDRTLSRKWEKYIYEVYKNKFGKQKIIKVPFIDKGDEKLNILARKNFILKKIKELL